MIKDAKINDSKLAAKKVEEAKVIQASLQSRITELELQLAHRDSNFLIRNNTSITPQVSAPIQFNMQEQKHL